MTVLVTGGNGQLGRTLRDTATDRRRTLFVDRTELDIVDKDSVESIVKSVKPTTIINAAGYTAVDSAESEHEAAFLVNEGGVANLARAAKAIGARLIHISTDFVFDGLKSTPYYPYDEAHPESVYGKSKLAGEIALQDILPGASVIIRTSWLYSEYGKNFVKSVLQLCATKGQLQIVSDQIGSPTWAGSLTNAVWTVVDSEKTIGILHWSDAGAASWYDFAVAIQEEALALGMLERAIPIYPIMSEDYPTAAARPAFSVLRRSPELVADQNPSAHWRANLRVMLAGIGK